MSAPFDHRPLYAQIELEAALAEARELAAMQRRLSLFAIEAHRIAMPALIGSASILGVICLIAQIAIRLHQAG